MIAALAGLILEQRNARPDAVLRVAVTGITASGKSTVAVELLGRIRELGLRCVRIPVDGFHNPRSLRYRRGRDSAEGYYRDAYDYDQLVRRGLVTEGDTQLYLVTNSCDEAAAEIDRFYRNYHSIRYVGDQVIIRLQHRLTDDQLAELNDRFGYLVARGRMERSGPMEIERRHDDHVELPRLRFAFSRHRSGDLRALIDVLNSFAPPPPARA